MRRLIAFLACALCVSLAQAQLLSAIGTAISIGQWIVQNQKKVYYIEVESQGNSFDDARQEAFRVAIEQAVGTLLVSETEVRNYRIHRNEIITYASGYVDRYEVYERGRQDGRVKLKIRVWVAHSAIAGRLLHQQAQPHEISGSTIATQVQSFQQQQQSADRLLNVVLQDFPNRAFDIVMEPAQVAMDSYRQGQLRIPFVVMWSQRYLDALAETLKNINQYPQCTRMMSDCTGARSRFEIAVNVFSKDPGAWFNDDAAWNVALNNMFVSKPHYRLTLHTNSGRTLQYCYLASELVDGLDYRPRYFTSIGLGFVKIHGNHRERIVLTMPLSQLPVQDITRAEVDVVRQANCN